jgi:hypothetical protein
VIVLAAVLGFLAAVVLGIFRDLVSQELKGRLDLLPHFILRLAATQLNKTQYDTIYKEEWLPELEFILKEAEGLPITRCITGTKYSLGLLISARRIARQLNRALGSSPAEQLFAEGSQSSVLSPGSRAITEPLVDAIVVPTTRTAEHLRPAVQLAANARCHLVVVYTDDPPPGLSEVLYGLRPDQVTLLTVRSDTKHPLLDLGATLPQSIVSPDELDISRKRNLGLLIGRACGWTRVLFLDDDIRKLNADKLSSAAALLDDHPVVGLPIKKYPDASVVGHAQRLAGRRYEPFVSGGSLLVDPQRLKGYFAPVCHEDWLCVINHLREGTITIGGSVGQLPYLPFAAPERARFEEFGDILLTGLLGLVNERRRKGAADEASPMADTEYWREATSPRFWKQILEQRAMLLADITARFKRNTFDGPSPLLSLAAASQRLSELKPADFVLFTEEWLTSLGEWRALLSALSRVDLPDKASAIEKALAELGIADVVRTYELYHPRARTRLTPWMYSIRLLGRLGRPYYRRRFGIGS